MATEIEELKLTAQCVRKMIINMIADAQCGHTGGSLSETDILVALYFKIMNIDPENPGMADRDRFLLSKGHSSPGFYSVLANRGFFHTDELATFDVINSKLQGHPCMIKTPGVDFSTGSLGQGISAGIGICLGRDARKKDFNVYVLVGDGELQEGQNWEAAMYAGARKTKGLITIVDYNKVQLVSATRDILDIDPLPAKWEAFGWQTLECDGHDMAALVETFEKAKVLSQDGPVAIVAHTVKGKGVSFMEDKAAWHGRAPNEEERKLALEEIDQHC